MQVIDEASSISPLTLDALEELIKRSSPKQVEEFAKTIQPQFKRWAPQPGKQSDAYFCEADELLYEEIARAGRYLIARTLLELHTAPQILVLANVWAKFLGALPFWIDARELDYGNGVDLFYRGGRYEDNLTRARRGNLLLFAFAITGLAAWVWRSFSPAIAVIATVIFQFRPREDIGATALALKAR